MKFNQIINKVLDKDHPRIKRAAWVNKKLGVGFPNSITIIVLNDTNGIIDTIYSFTAEDFIASDWEVID